MAEKKHYSQQDKINFIVSLYPAAREASRKSGMSWELILAQAAQETGWGEKVLPGSNNVFNIKTGSSWKGDSKVYHVWEKQNGKKVWVDDAFRVYPSVADSLADRMQMLQNSSRYAKAGLMDPGVKGNMEKEAHALKKGGYATAENYAESMIELFHGRTMRHALAEARKRHPEFDSAGQAKPAVASQAPHSSAAQASPPPAKAVSASVAHDKPAQPVAAHAAQQQAQQPKQSQPSAAAASAPSAERVQTLLPEAQQHLVQEAKNAVQALQQRDARLQKLDAAQLDNLSGQLAVDAARQGMAKINGAVVNAADPGKISLVGQDAGNKLQQVSAEFGAAPAAPSPNQPASTVAAQPQSGASPAQPTPAKPVEQAAAAKPQIEQAKPAAPQAAHVSHPPAQGAHGPAKATAPAGPAQSAHAQHMPAQAAHAQAKAAAHAGQDKSQHPQPVAGNDRGSRMVNAALEHFGDGTFEYGRADMAGQLANKKKPNGNRIDGSRLEADTDHDGKKGVDCSSLVWRTLQLGNTKVTDDFKSAANFTTHTLFNGGHGGQHPHANITDYAKRNFNVIDNKKDLQPGDILMFKMAGGGQHVAVYKGKNEKGEQMFYGSQTSTGPAEVNLSSNPYWSKQAFLGALRPKDDFYKPDAAPQAVQHAGLSDGKQSLLEQTRQHVGSLQQRDGRLKDLASHQVDNLSAALAVEGWKKGIEKVGAVMVNAVDPGKISMLYKSAANKVEHAAVELRDAIKQSAQHSLSLLAAAPEHGQPAAKAQAHQPPARAKQPAMGM
ncbi:glucosaminidase domain-containing protein [Chromobacterium subtsugae]|uniref:glucosaminidase domain-containing protein n=1 Tax=Chromobacterium subtsugae TaxID=251747 RepID=UPI00069A69B2|nr:glucosaminidase domain-containing protein [Chromobacterium subtsugae]